MTTTHSNRPTHRIYAVAKVGDKKFWQPIGALWAWQGFQPKRAIFSATTKRDPLRQD